jgi:hypothetical protein
MPTKKAKRLPVVDSWRPLHLQTCNQGAGRLLRVFALQGNKGVPAGGRSARWRLPELPPRFPSISWLGGVSERAYWTTGKT